MSSLSEDDPLRMTIEPYTAEHRDAVVQLSLRAWAPVFASLQSALEPAISQVLFSDWRASQRQAVEAVCDDEDAHVWVAIVGGEPVGFVAVKLHAAEKIGEVYMIAVDPAAQRRGVGAALMAFATDWMREAGMLVAMVATGGDPGHAPARRAYEKLGFAPLPLAQYYKRL
ncbi:MAG TPA: GNAT family N-acetyltransferase [Chloroflexaceae bacterium]|nr:GNAT family N-acetyltransferase [Chloroflexaceae bacterium]